ncbi:hypothetical protein ACLMJK_006267 [Lecanora helva]
MTKYVNRPNSVPSLPPRPTLPSKGEELNIRDHATLAFPSNNKLIVTTTKGVYSWDGVAVSELFHSGSKGIVAAKKLTNEKDMLAVADSQVVVLHNTKGEPQRTYRLKGSEGQIRLLRYAKESNKLFFTTSLRNAVQTYSLQNSILQDTCHKHPTPPSVFTVSSDCQYLLSTSTAPSTIYLTDLCGNMAPVLIQPGCSQSEVVAAAFHPETASIFLLAFADGTAAMFDALYFFPKHLNRTQGTKATTSSTGGEVAFLKGLHAQGFAKISDLDCVNGLDTGTGSAGSTRNNRVTAVTFVPGRKATVVTVGADGKCCIVDFTQSLKRNAVLLKSWHLRRPATSLSVIHYKIDLPSSQTDGSADVATAGAPDPSNDAYYIAIGREDGRVLLFDLSGKHIGERALGSDGEPIVDVEWIQGERDGHDHNHTKLIPTTLETGDQSINGIDLINVEPGRLRKTTFPPKLTSRLSAADGSARQLFDSLMPQKSMQRPLGEAQPGHPTTAANHLDIMEKSMRKSEEAGSGQHRSPSSDVTSAVTSTKTVSKAGTPRSPEQSLPKPSKGSSPERGATPPVPPRPNPRPGGLLYQRRAQSSHESPANNSYPTFIANARKVRSTSPPKSRSFFGPRPMPRLATNGSRKDVNPEQEDSENFGGKSSDTPPKPPPHISTAKDVSPAASVESFQTASSQVDSYLPSARSIDTVVDWEVGKTREPLPASDELQRPRREIDGQKQPKKKGHISLSLSSASLATRALTSLSPSNSANPIIQLPAESPGYSAPGLHAALGPIEGPARSKSVQKGHVSVPISSASASTMTSISPASSGAVVQWPSLKKSPRIPELSKALSFSSRKSVPRSATNGASTTDSPPKANGSESHAPNGDKTVARTPSSISYSSKMESLLHASLSGFRDEMVLKFEEQRIWLEELVRSEDEGRWVLEEENRFLRDELARVKGDNSERT